MPDPSPICTHPDDEWCDACFVPTRHLTTLYSLDREANLAGPAGHQRPFEPSAEQVREWQQVLAGAGLPDDLPPELTGPHAAPVDPPWWEQRVSQRRVVGPATDPELRQLAEAAHAAVATGVAKVVADAPKPCVNRRHTHGVYAWKEACLDATVPPYPWVHRATGQAVITTLVVVGACGVAGWKAGEWLATQAALRLELYRMRRGA